jgi:hypothetical protein
MSLFGCSCNCRPTCTGLAVIAAAVLGVLAAFLVLGGVIAVSVALIAVFFGIAVGYLAVVTVAAALARRHGCCVSLGAVLTGALGTITTAVILLVAGIAGGVLGAILAGVLVFFFALTLGATACYARCLCENAE